MEDVGLVDELCGVVGRRHRCWRCVRSRESEAPNFQIELCRRQLGVTQLISTKTCFGAPALTRTITKDPTSAVYSEKARICLTAS